MGHTNYWRRKPELPAKAFAAVVKDIKLVIKHLGILLGGRDGTGLPVLRADFVAFNGKSPDHCETFAVERTANARDGQSEVFQFCKTNQRPYDLYVQIALIVLKHHLDEAISVSSDGSESNWDTARAKCQKWLGYGGEFRLEK